MFEVLERTMRGNHAKAKSYSEAETGTNRTVETNDQYEPNTPYSW